ncbi:MAG: tetratricopeptide repeat protein [Erysipelotrichaceae bacterium]|nr:tetratricopeptide repeat protein [Erysipelotrichaceae bacterium]
MALKKNAHQLFTDREEPRQAFWNTLRKLEENPRSSQVITYYGEGGIGKSWLLNDIKRRLEQHDPEGNESFFDDGFVIRGNYVPVYYNLETSTDPVEILCMLRYSLYNIDPKLAFPVFDCAIKKYKDLTNRNLATGESSNSSLAMYENILDTAALLIPQLGPLNTVYGYMKKGYGTVKPFLSKIRDRFIREKYEEYFGVIADAGTADDIRENIAEFFKTDLNMQERFFSIVFFIDTYEILTFKTGLRTHRWLSEELAGETENTLWVFAGRNKIYQNYDNEHLIGDLSEEDSVYYLREKAGIEDEAIIQKIAEIAKGTPIFLDLCVQNYRNEGYPSIEEFRNFNKEQLLKRYVKYLDYGEKLTIRLMSSMGHWTDADYREVFNKIHNGSFSQYHEAYNKVVSSTMIEKDNEDRYFLHRAVRTGIYEDPDYPDEIKTASEDAMLELYVERAYSQSDPVYYAERFIDLIESLAAEGEHFDDEQYFSLAYGLIFLSEDLYAKGKNTLVSFYERIKEDVEKLIFSSHSEAYVRLFLAYAALLSTDYERAKNESRRASALLRRLAGKNSRSTILAERIFATCNLAKGRYRQGIEQLEECLNKFSEKYPDRDPDQDIATVGVRQLIMIVKGRLNINEADLKKMLDEHIGKFGWEDGRTLMTAQNYAESLRISGRFEEAGEISEKAYQASVKLMGKTHEYTILLLSLLALNLYDANEKERGRKLIEEAYQTAIDELGEDDKLTGSIIANRGYMKYMDEEHKEALLDFHKAINIFAKYEGALETAQAATIYTNAADIYRLASMYQEAIDLYDLAYGILVKEYDISHPEVLYILAMKGFCLLYLNKSDQAVKLCEESWHQADRTLGTDSAITYKTAWALACVYEDLNIQSEEAGRIYAYLADYYRKEFDDEDSAKHYEQLAAVIQKKLQKSLKS